MIQKTHIKKGGAKFPSTKLITTMIASNTFNKDRYITQSEVILKLELEINSVSCEIFTACLDLESAQLLIERSIAFSDKFKNEGQRKATLALQLNTQFILDQRKAIANLKFRKAHIEAQLGAATRLFKIQLAQLKNKT